MVDIYGRSSHLHLDLDSHTEHTGGLASYLLGCKQAIKQSDNTQTSSGRPTLCLEACDHFLPSLSLQIGIRYLCVVFSLVLVNLSFVREYAWCPLSPSLQFPSPTLSYLLPPSRLSRIPFHFHIIPLRFNLLHAPDHGYGVCMYISPN